MTRTIILIAIGHPLLTPRDSITPNAQYIHEAPLWSYCHLEAYQDRSIDVVRLVAVRSLLADIRAETGYTLYTA